MSEDRIATPVLLKDEDMQTSLKKGLDETNYKIFFLILFVVLFVFINMPLIGLLFFLYISQIIAFCADKLSITYPNKTTCYTFVQYETYYLDAEAYCIKKGGHLATINNVMENVLITRKFFCRLLMVTYIIYL